MIDLYPGIPVDHWKLLDFSAISEIAQRGFEAARDKIEDWRKSIPKQGS